ncbi:putative neopullulanase 1 [Clostridium sp. CAG:411]|jgi:alpha-glucosidase|nr:putative neopullulanase 1 [Clostridium sp. CAG:411]
MGINFSLNFTQMTREEKVRLYIDNLSQALNRAALFSDGTKEYREPAEPMPYDKVKLRFRTARDNVDMVYVVTNNEKLEMEKVHDDRLFDYYQVEVPLTDQRMEYYFEIRAGRAVCYYNAKGVFNEVQSYYNFFIKPGFTTPDWAKGAVIYQIYVDRFCKGDENNTVETNEYYYIGEGTVKVDDWNKYPAVMGVREFYGGDLQGVMDKLDYLQDLGVEVIYFNPLFVSPSNHKYDIQDYDYIDPHIGKIVKDEGELLPPGVTENAQASKYICRVTDKENLEASNAFFAQLVEEIHKRGMKVILDGVFNHCGSFNKWLDRERIYENQEGYEKGAYIAEDSPYHTFFKFHEQHAWPYNHTYDGWWGHDTLPKLNYEDSPKLFEYIMRIARKWVSPPYNVDGWRLDVAADLGHSPEYNHYFWKNFRKNVKEANPNAIILAEHYGEPTAWLQGDEWDTVMNYDAFMEPLTWFLTGMEKHSDEQRQDLLGNTDAFYGSMSHHMTRFNTQSLQVAMNELSNHDHSRFLTRTNHYVGRTASLGPEAANQHLNYGVMREAVLIQMTWPGAPTIYYGDEAGVCGWTDPDNRRTYPWGHENKELIALHKELIQIHKDYQALRTGSIKFLYGTYNVIAYGRFDAQDKLVAAVNNNDGEVTFKIPVWEIGILDGTEMVRLILTTQDGYTQEATTHKIEAGYLILTLPPFSGAILKDVNHE